MPRGGDPARLGSLLEHGLRPVPVEDAAGRGSGPGIGPRGASEPGVDLWQRFPQFAHYVEEAERLLQDRHSRGFYVMALKKLYPQHMAVWQRALTAAREQTNIRRSRGALFTRLLRTFAAEAGVAL